MFCFFCPADEDSTEAVEPADCAFYNPASCFEPCFFLDEFGFFFAWAHVECKSEFVSEFAYFITLVPGIKAQVLFVLFCCSWFFHNNVFYCWAR